MDRAYDLPSRAEMEAAIVAFAEQAKLEVRYGCTWESTTRDEEASRSSPTRASTAAAPCVFAIGVTEPWRAPVPGLEHAAHYVDTVVAGAVRRAQRLHRRQAKLRLRGGPGILPWARNIDPRLPEARCDTDALALSALRIRYLHPYDEYSRGGPGTYVLDVTIEPDRPERGRVPRRDAGNDLGRPPRVRRRRRDRGDRVPDAARRPAEARAS